MPTEALVAGSGAAPDTLTAAARPGTATFRPRMVTAIGPNYSGTTLLAMLIDCHPQIASVGECALNRHARERQREDGSPQFACSCLQPIGQCPFWGSLFERMHELGYPLDANNWITDYKYRSDLMNTALGMYNSRGWFRQLQNLADGYLPIHRSRLQRTTEARVAFVRTVLERTGKQVFFDTTKYVLQAHYMAHEPALDVKFLRIVRDPRSYVASSLRRGHELEERAHSWVSFHQATNHMLAPVPPDRIMVISYEDLCRSPIDVQRTIYAFCGVDDVPPPTAVAPRDHHVIGNPVRLKDRLTVRLVESWREELTADQQSRILRIAGPMAESLGLSRE